MNDIMKIVSWRIWFINERCYNSKSEIIQNDGKEQKDGFLSTLIGALGARLLGNLLTGKGTIRASERTIRADAGTIKAGENF